MTLVTNPGVPGPLFPVNAATYTGGPDQPWVRTVTVPKGGGGTIDHIYIGFNDLNNNGGTASVRYSMNGGATFANRLLDRTYAGSVGQDSPAVRLAISPNGNTVYALFQRWNSFLGISLGADVLGDVVLTRDDNATGTFSALGPGGNGTNIASGIRLPVTTTVGQERLGSGCDVALCPFNPNKVYVAYTGVSGFNIVQGNPYIVVEVSLDGGQTFAHLYQTTTFSSLPSLAVLQDGTVGLLYFQRNGIYDQVVFSKALQGNFNNIITRTLASWPDGLGNEFATPLYVGDYFQLRAVGNNFYGVFSAYNDPSQPSYFPCLPYYQRNIKFIGTGIVDHDVTLGVAANLYDAGTQIAPSIDPFFFYDIAAQYVAINEVIQGSPLWRTTSSLDALDPLSGTTHLVWPVLPADAPPLQLEASPALGAGANWRIQSNNIIQTNGQLEFAPDPTQSSQFFRLSQNVASGQFPIFTGVDNNGSLSPSGLLTNTGLSSQTFTATPSNNYVVGNWYLDGAVVASNTPTLTISNIAAEHTLLVTFEPTNDIAVSLSGNALVRGPATVTNAFIYQVNVANTGLGTVTGVTMTNVLDPNVSFVSATTGQGTVTNSGNLVTASIGTLSNSASTTIMITVIPNIETNIFDTATVACDQFEPDLANNTATFMATVITPVTITEDPTNESVSTGNTATFSITAAGTPPYFYQWFFNGGVIGGATNATLTLTNVTTANAGTYTAEALQVFDADDVEQADSTPATLTVDGILVVQNNVRPKRGKPVR